MRMASYLDIMRLFKWLTQCRNKNIPVNEGTFLFEKANEYA